MNVRLVAGIFVLALSAAAGCGDDDGQGGAGGNGGSGGNGGDGGADATSTGTGTGGTGGEPAGTGGTGGEPAGTGGTGGEPAGTGGTGGEPTGTGGTGGEPTGTGGTGGEPAGTGGTGGEAAGTGGTGGEPAGTGGSGGEPTGTGGTGGEPTGTGGTGGEPTGTGGGGGAASTLYEACATDAECTGQSCLSEEDYGYPLGLCSTLCAPEAEPTAGGACDGGVCVGFSEGEGACLALCSASSACRDGYACEDIGGGIQACVPRCTSDAQCPSRGACDTLTGVCTLAETDCANYEDDDGDESYDCADTDCAATCAPIAEAACASATPIVSTTIHGDTSGGTSGLEGTCFLGNTGHGPEEIHLFTPPAGQSGTLVIELESPTDHSVYARSSCADMRSEIGCSDENSPYDGLPDEERIEIDVRVGQAVPIVVDAYEPREAGPYTLNLRFTPILCGDGTVGSTEECDDGNTTSGDGCSATCVYEPDVLCEDAAELVIGENMGSTTAGASVFEGTCIGWDLPEAIHRFTPPSDGTLTLTLSAEADLGFYLRESCADFGSELECADDGRRGDDETLAIDVTRGEPLFVIVDTYMPIGGGPYTLTVAFTPAP
ncbi:DUF4215 domain-containing protein [Sorangium sp. So ce385]|uniref:DUF4215 domain-containing protein n=1 Tax=Sorangium sp. So ce385 TaxID=3133308 RepID=UPI003F5BF993